MLAGINQPFNLAYSRSFHKNDVLLFGSRIEEVARHCGMSVLAGRLFVNPPKLIKRLSYGSTWAGSANLSNIR